MQTGETTMFHTLNLFLAPGTSPGLDVEAVNSTVSNSEAPLAHRTKVHAKLKFHLSVLGNAFGFLLLVSGAWLSLILLQVLIAP
jgi:hypothetical protein